MSDTQMKRAPMRTIHGLSVRSEIEARLAAAREETRTATLDEAIAFLGGSGFAEAAETLRIAAFEPRGEVGNG